MVVNCFQKLLPSWWRTTAVFLCTTFVKLWIAFKNYYLRDEGQHDRVLQSAINSCELLSKIITFVMKDNKIFEIESSKSVVNCFQKLLPSWWRTTSGFFKDSKHALWIAFKNYYLRDEGQRRWWSVHNLSRCELLSKIITFVMKDNLCENYPGKTYVVNCFQKLLPSWWRTTHYSNIWELLQLWIAFKNYYLRDEGQLLTAQFVLRLRCELLSKIITFVMKDNLKVG